MWEEGTGGRRAWVGRYDGGSGRLGKECRLKRVRDTD